MYELQQHRLKEMQRARSFGDAAAAAADPTVTQVPTRPPVAGHAAPATRGPLGANNPLVNAANAQAASATPAPQQSLVQAAGLQRGIAPGVYQHGRGQYSDNPEGMGFAPGFTGRPSTQNDSAAENLAQRSAARGPSMVERMSEQQSQNLTPETSGSGFGLLDTGARDRRSAMMDAQQFKPGARQTLASVLRQQEQAPQLQEQRRQSLVDAAFRRDQFGAQREDSAADRGLQREGLRARTMAEAARLQAEAPKRQGESLVQAMRNQIASEQDPARRQSLVQHLRDVEGKEPQTSNDNSLPVGALKMQQEDLDAMGLASSSSADLGAIGKQIDDGTLKLGPVRNLWNRGRNAVGASTEESRALSSTQATLEKLRNDSLRLNKGVQTEGDAQRAWNEMFQSMSDPKLVRQRLGEIQAINERAAAMRGANVQTLRENYGAAPLDLSTRSNVQPAVGHQSTGAQSNNTQPVAVASQEQWAALPSGTLYTAPDGTTRRKQ